MVLRGWIGSGRGPAAWVLLLLLLAGGSAPRPAHCLGWLRGLRHSLEHALLRAPRAHPLPETPPGQQRMLPQSHSAPGERGESDGQLPGPEGGGPKGQLQGPEGGGTKGQLQAPKLGSSEGALRLQAPEPGNARLVKAGPGAARGTQAVPSKGQGATSRSAGLQGEKRGPEKSSAEGTPGAPRVEEGQRERSTKGVHPGEGPAGSGAPERMRVATSTRFVPAATIRYDAGRWLPFSHVLASGEAFDRAETRQQSCFKLFALDTAGNCFDKGKQQRAFFTGAIRSSETGVVEALDIKYDFILAHHACYFLETPGVYELAVYLEFTNAHAMIMKRNGSNAEGFVRHRLVARSTVEVSASGGRQAMPHTLQRRSVRWRPKGALAQESRAGGETEGLPPCSLDVLGRTRNRGYWLNSTWHPLHCQHHALPLEDVLSCLSGKRILMLGDSQMRYTLGTLFDFLHAPSRGSFLAKGQLNPKYAPGIPVRGAQGRSGSPFEAPGSAGKGDAPVRRALAFSRHERTGSRFSFYGTFFEGFAHYSVVRRMRSKGWASFNITYVAQLGTSKPLVAPWMLDRAVTGGASAMDGAPFDHALVAISLHDLKYFGNHRHFANKLRVRFLPQLRELVRSPDDVTFVGMWAAQDGMKQVRHVHLSNNLRGFDFEDTAVRVLREEGFKRVLLTRFMTAPRRDLCHDSTHYSWPVSFTSLDLFFSSVCKYDKQDSKQHTNLL